MKIELIDREEFERRTKYWIETEAWECPVCGKGDVFRTRVLYSDKAKPKPNPWKWVERYDYCDVL